MSPLMRLVTFLYFLALYSSIHQSVYGSLYSACSVYDNFTSNDPYETNSKELMSYLKYEMNPKKGFVLGSKGQGLNRVHGLALCAIGVSTQACIAWPETFEPRKLELLSNVSRKASRTPRLDATGEFEVDRSVKIFGSPQCTRDLSSYECRKCLDGAISLLKSCCKRQEGARVFT
ncbi:Gnk2-like domain containing protein [Trema orientale]|uniref:Gnk2-like domain containing protein n=1 Tax=Trema orientale TaxID=63057 RepID=A0A2P5BT15_TREOI|nr:Gnk2-like domain containing protein [Trema orientale]